MDMRCPKCNGTDLKKLSLAYEEGLYRTDARTRLSAALVGGGGPDLLVGRATTQASHQSALSKRLKPPTKWSYLKVISWSVLGFLCFGWLVFYINTVTTSAATVTSAPLGAYAVIGGVIFALILALALRHNQSVYPRRLAEWDRSFLCPRCGTICKQEVFQEGTN